MLNIKWKPVDTTIDKSKLRKQIEEQTQEYLNNGGIIKKPPKRIREYNPKVDSSYNTKK